ncbi:ABC transporter permease [Proteiniclasticum sp. C24MP]|uniref:ABC transporter permease n=1 Tax=Proteiniclasticum sp. C24MP TaxID=3374101 RepID=UPI00375466ED
MRSFLAFTKKELMESTRTYKLFVLLTVFVIFGFMNPIMAKVMPELLNEFLPDSITITLEEPKALDSWMQFFKNVSQTGMIVMVIVFSGIMANEISKGTLTIMLTKGLQRKAVILSKFAAGVMQWTLAYILCFLITYLYTIYFWSMNEISNLGLAVISLWVFGIMLVALTIFGGLLFKNTYGALLLTGGVVMIFTILNIFPKIKPYNPMTLVSDSIPLLTRDFLPRDMISALVVTIVITVVVLVSALVDWIRLN